MQAAPSTPSLALLTSAVVMVAFTSPLTAAMMSSNTLLILLSSFNRLFSASTSASADTHSGVRAPDASQGRRTLRGMDSVSA